MTRQAWLIDKGHLFGKVIYIYFCFYAMAVAERFSMSIVYGAALFISLSALTRMLRYKTTHDMRWPKAFKWTLVVFFILSTLYILVLHPFLYHKPYTLVAVAIILLPFIERSAEDALLRKKSMTPRRLMLRVLPLEAALVLLTALLVWASGRAAFEFIMAAALGMALFFVRQLIFADYASDHPQPPQFDGIRQIRSARIYDGMVIASGASLNIFAFAYILYIMLSGRIVFFESFFVVFAVIAALFGIMALSTQRFLRTSLMHRIGKNAAFVLGTAIAIFAAYVMRGNWFLGGIAGTVQVVLLLLGLTLQTTAALGLREDIAMVIKLRDKDIDEDALDKRARRLEHWTALISEVIVLIVLALLISDPIFLDADLDAYIELAPQIGSSVVVIPTVFLFVALFFSVKQPLTEKYARRLKNFLLRKERGEHNPEMEERLHTVLIKAYKKRIGVHIIRAFLKPVMFHSVTGKENVDALPGIFVFNHREVYGPIAAVVFLPYDMRPWILSRMIDKQQVTEHMYEGTFSRITWLPALLRKLLTRVAAPLVVWALSSFDPIPVYRGTAKSVIKTFELSIACLRAGDSILLFPENPEERYTDNEKVSDFYRGFAHLGRLYYKRTKECVTFYPVYASKAARMLRIGEGIIYDPANGRKEEGRIVEALESRMRALQQIDLS